MSDVERMLENMASKIAERDAVISRLAGTLELISKTPGMVARWTANGWTIDDIVESIADQAHRSLIDDE